ncbi:3CxxC-type zinc finger protein [Aspergillus puulaauensis]|uniref:3CxxC-type domain-containing protein n=1 Tax=Aspergillus puulaauensis TaxID=1220207 RepID=A0A7R7XBN6_9EURO|nr:uncharacterized protein APUU_10587A [Aspergillus puulaauensis]BCS17759.1 hypothetical protein APUU_10587A [Aspergillus puulaauensis]
MARKAAYNSCSAQPRFHKSVVALVKQYTNLTFIFRHNDTDLKATDIWNTNVMGQFTCPNENCRKSGWSSKKIAIRIRMYPGRRYNARVYHQRCKKCERLGELELDDSYAERVAYWLLKWNGVELEKPSHAGQSKGPHNKKLCEGCKAGHCEE